MKADKELEEIEGLEDEIKQVADLMNKEERPKAFLRVRRTLQDLARAKKIILEDLSPDKCANPYCEKTPKYPSNRPRYCRECYEIKAS